MVELEFFSKGSALEYNKILTTKNPLIPKQTSNGFTHCGQLLRKHLMLPLISICEILILK